MRMYDYLVPSVNFMGANSISVVGERCKILGGKKALIVTDKFLRGLEGGAVDLTVKYLKEAGIDNMRKEKMEITKYFLDQVKEIDGVKVAGKKTVEGRLGVVSIDFEGFDNSIVSFYLSSKYKIMTRVGMHCAPRAHKTLKTFPQGTVRFSFSHFNTKEEVDICINAIKTILSDLRQGGELI